MTKPKKAAKRTVKTGGARGRPPKRVDPVSSGEEATTSHKGETSEDVAHEGQESENITSPEIQDTAVFTTQETYASKSAQSLHDDAVNDHTPQHKQHSLVRAAVQYPDIKSTPRPTTTQVQYPDIEPISQSIETQHEQVDTVAATDFIDPYIPHDEHAASQHDEGVADAYAGAGGVMANNAIVRPEFLHAVISSPSLPPGRHEDYLEPATGPASAQPVDGAEHMAPATPTTPRSSSTGGPNPRRATVSSYLWRPSPKFCAAWEQATATRPLIDWRAAPAFKDPRSRSRKSAEPDGPAKGNPRSRSSKSTESDRPPAPYPVEKWLISLPVEGAWGPPPSDGESNASVAESVKPDLAGDQQLDTLVPPFSTSLRLGPSANLLPTLQEMNDGNAQPLDQGSDQGEPAANLQQQVIDLTSDPVDQQRGIVTTVETTVETLGHGGMVAKAIQTSESLASYSATPNRQDPQLSFVRSSPTEGSPSTQRPFSGKVFIAVWAEKDPSELPETMVDRKCDAFYLVPFDGVRKILGKHSSERTNQLKLAIESVQQKYDALSMPAAPQSVQQGTAPTSKPAPTQPVQPKNASTSQPAATQPVQPRRGPSAKPTQGQERKRKRHNWPGDDEDEAEESNKRLQSQHPSEGKYSAQAPDDRTQNPGGQPAEGGKPAAQQPAQQSAQQPVQPQSSMPRPRPAQSDSEFEPETPRPVKKSKLREALLVQKRKEWDRYDEKRKQEAEKEAKAAIERVRELVKKRMATERDIELGRQATQELQQHEKDLVDAALQTLLGEAMDQGRMPVGVTADEVYKVLKEQQAEEKKQAEKAAKKAAEAADVAPETPARPTQSRTATTEPQRPAATPQRGWGLSTFIPSTIGRIVGSVRRRPAPATNGASFGPNTVAETALGGTSAAEQHEPPAPNRSRTEVLGKRSRADVEEFIKPTQLQHDFAEDILGKFEKHVGDMVEKRVREEMEKKQAEMAEELKRKEAELAKQAGAGRKDRRTSSHTIQNPAGGFGLDDDFFASSSASSGEDSSEEVKIVSTKRQKLDAGRSQATKTMALFDRDGEAVARAKGKERGEAAPSSWRRFLTSAPTVSDEFNKLKPSMARHDDPTRSVEARTVRGPDGRMRVYEGDSFREETEQERNRRIDRLIGLTEPGPDTTPFDLTVKGFGFKPDFTDPTKSYGQYLQEKANRQRFLEPTSVGPSNKPDEVPNVPGAFVLSPPSEDGHQRPLQTLQQPRTGSPLKPLAKQATQGPKRDAQGRTAMDLFAESIKDQQAQIRGPTAALPAEFGARSQSGSDENEEPAEAVASTTVGPFPPGLFRPAASQPGTLKSALTKSVPAEAGPPRPPLSKSVSFAPGAAPKSPPKQPVLAKAAPESESLVGRTNIFRTFFPDATAEEEATTHLPPGLFSPPGSKPAAPAPTAAKPSLFTAQPTHPFFQLPPSQPAASEPAPSQPATSKPAAAPLATTASTLFAPSASAPSIFQSVTPQPATTTPSLFVPSASKPSLFQSVASQPAAAKPTTSQPAPTASSLFPPSAPAPSIFQSAPAQPATPEPATSTPGGPGSLYKRPTNPNSVFAPMKYQKERPIFQSKPPQPSTSAPATTTAETPSPTAVDEAPPLVSEPATEEEDNTPAENYAENLAKGNIPPGLKLPEASDKHKVTPQLMWFANMVESLGNPDYAGFAGKTN